MTKFSFCLNKLHELTRLILIDRNRGFFYLFEQSRKQLFKLLMLVLTAIRNNC